MAGKVLGKNKIKILKSISPNKTLEGYFGSILIGFVAGFIYLNILVLENPINFSTKLLLIFSVIFSSIFGDLFVSKVKRSIQVKVISLKFYMDMVEFQTDSILFYLVLLYLFGYSF